MYKKVLFISCFFGAKEFFYVNFDFKNGCENEFKDENEKPCI